MARVCLNGLQCGNTMLPSLDVEEQTLVGAVADIFAEVVVCWVKPHNARTLAWETCGIFEDRHKTGFGELD